jgi:hypothetical protein
MVLFKGTKMSRNLLKLISEKFTSGNSVEVERITITRAEYEQELAKPEQEPVGWFLKDHLETYMESYKDIKGAIPLYTAPPRKEWVGLTDNEQYQIVTQCGAMSADWQDFVVAVEQTLKDKNT